MSILRRTVRTVSARALPVVLLLGLFGGASQADAAVILDFTLTGEGNTYTWSLSSEPDPSLSNPGGFRVDSLAISTNGSAPVTGDVVFFTSAAAGGLTLLSLPLFFDGPQLFTGPTNDPIILTGQFPLTLSAPNLPTYSLTIAEATAVPEPASMLLLGTGGVTLAASLRRRRKQKISA